MVKGIDACLFDIIACKKSDSSTFLKRIMIL